MRCNRFAVKRAKMYADCAVKFLLKKFFPAIMRSIRSKRQNIMSGMTKKFYEKERFNLAKRSASGDGSLQKIE